MERPAERTGGGSQPPVLDGLRLEEWVGTRNRPFNMGRENAPFENSDSAFCFKKKAEQIYKSLFVFKLRQYKSYGCG
jgi:hypothetical protein